MAVPSDYLNGNVTFTRSGKVVNVNFFTSTKKSVAAWASQRICSIPNGMAPVRGTEWNHGSATVQDGKTTLLVSTVNGLYLENKTSSSIGSGTWVEGYLTYICE